MKDLKERMKEILDKPDWKRPTYYHHPDKERTRSMYRFQTSRHLIIPDGVERIWEGAYSTQDEINGVKVPIKTIYTLIDFPSTLTYIGRKAFYRQSLLTTLHLPKKLKEIGEEAFSGCVKLREIHIYKGTKFGHRTFPPQAKIIYYG